MGGELSKYVTVSLPAAIGRAIDGLIDELGYWPSRGAFVREACLEKIRAEWLRLRELRASDAGSVRGVRPRRGTNPGISPREAAGRGASEHESSPKRGEKK